MVDLHMMTITGGRTRSVAEFDALLAQAGLTLAKVTPTRLGPRRSATTPAADAAEHDVHQVEEVAHPAALAEGES